MVVGHPPPPKLGGHPDSRLLVCWRGGHIQALGAVPRSRDPVLRAKGTKLNSMNPLAACWPGGRGRTQEARGGGPSLTYPGALPTGGYWGGPQIRATMCLPCHPPAAIPIGTHWVHTVPRMAPLALGTGPMVLGTVLTEPAPGLQVRHISLPIVGGGSACGQQELCVRPQWRCCLP